VAFADITCLSKLDFQDNLLINAMRWGYTVYGSKGHKPMLGWAAERQCSLLENKDRLAWVLEFQIDSMGKIEPYSVKVIRAKIRNQMQMDYDSAPEDAYTEELQDGLRNCSTL
jgi:exoribonuclease R